RQIVDPNFESKVRELVALTRSCTIAQILELRHLTLNSADWSSGNQARVIFNVVLTAKLQDLGEELLHAAQHDRYEKLLPPIGKNYTEDQRENDRETLANTAIQALAGLFYAALQRAVDPKFEGKVHEMLLATRGYSLAQILAMRNEVLGDPATRAWASSVQVKVIFNVALTSKLQGMGEIALHEAQLTDCERLLASESPTYSAQMREADREILANAVVQALAVLVHGSMSAKPKANERVYWKSETPPEPKKPTLVPVPASAVVAPSPAPAPAPPAALPKMEAVVRRPPPAAKVPAAPTPAPVPVKEKTAEPPAQVSAPQDDPPPPPPPPPPKKATSTVDFAKLFDDTIFAHVKRPLELLQVTGQREQGMPFILAPSFTELFGTLLRTYVLPRMRMSRFIRTMSESYNWDEVGAAAIIEIIHSGEANNPILHTWDSRWQELKSAPPKAVVPEKKGGFFGGKSKAAEPPAVSERETSAREMWAQVDDHARKNGYSPPLPRDVEIFETLIRIRPEVLTKAMTELQHLYNQEFAPSKSQEQGREGSFRDGLNKWADRLPPYVGEFLTMRSIYIHPKCDLEFLKNFTKSHGKTVAERKRAIPHVMDFISSMDPSAV
ncbi:MAG: hypothetical protein ABT940_12745, partial [Alphaproteobacteria bacterium]